MATTVTTATLKVDITETITLNGTTYDKTTTQSITGIAQYTSRVYQLKASTTHTVVEFASDPSFVISALTVDSNTSGSAITSLGHTISDLFIRTGASETDVEIVVATA